MSEPGDLPDRVDESELPAALGPVLTRSAEGGVTVITRNGEPIAAVVSMRDLEAAEEEVDRRLAAREPPTDDGTRTSLSDLLAEHTKGDE
ncbi:type II toxin-antitoxin system prevent-host-death family antitoxin [Streptomyces marincola]|uniref:type II toxin-antitoxin system prevent-host-death family antitoxin n=1 Tax=Streptomyces marincola TaxID=2878388 RepID=UPI001CF5EA99|nr:type II toxin-antitoxin system prevent-host-death family antitoxin [Streptomyces marincola]UCM88502.1 type II toxin-antitoxin system prevent-host-death family antitoxin [Streptomyces marincola]